eukprot:SAG31_NODE_11809_length_996_cov_1.094760_3_plen_109_part_01
MDRSTFLDPPQAAAEVVDESIEPYISLLGPGEVQFMTGEPLADQESLQYGDPRVRDEAHRRWSQAVQAWTAEEKMGVCAMLRLTIRALRSALANSRQEEGQKAGGLLGL